jgi:hypothetical protein
LTTCFDHHFIFEKGLNICADPGSGVAPVSAEIKGSGLSMDGAEITLDFPPDVFYFLSCFKRRHA